MKQPTPWWMWLLPLPVVWWAALLTAGAWQPGMDLLQLMAGLSTVLQRPWDIRWTQYSGRCLLNVAPIRYRPVRLVEQGKCFFKEKAF